MKFRENKVLGEERKEGRIASIICSNILDALTAWKIPSLLWDTKKKNQHKLMRIKLTTIKQATLYLADIWCLVPLSE